MWNLVVSHFKSYAGWGLIFFFYLAALIWLFVTEKRKERRIVFIYMPLILLFLFLNPLSAHIMEKFAGDEIYYRLLWMLPVTITLADAATEIVIKIGGKLKVFAIAAFCALFILGGRLIYTDSRYSIAENEYHVPDDVAEICDRIVIPGREVLAAFPEEMIVYVRQYTALVVMPYGWADTEYGPIFNTDLMEAMQEEILDLDRIGTEAKEIECHYVIIDDTKESTGSMLDQGFEEYAKVEHYTIYKNPEQYFSIYY